MLDSRRIPDPFSEVEVIIALSNDAQTSDYIVLTRGKTHLINGRCFQPRLSKTSAFANFLQRYAIRCSGSEDSEYGKQ